MPAISAPCPPPALVVAGVRHRELIAAVVDGPLAEQPPAAYLVVRSGEPRVLAYVPGHRAPRDLTGGAADGPPTRPPRRVALTCPSPILRYVRLVLAPALPPSPAGTDILADAVAGSAGLVYVLDASEPLSPDRRDELTALAGAARGVALVDLGEATEAARAVIVRQVPRLATATWHSSGDPTTALTPPAPEPVPSGLRSEATREDGTSEGSGARAGGAGASTAEPQAGAVRVIDDDTRWRDVLVTELRSASAAARRRLAAALPAIEARCALDPAGLPALLDAELHALSLRTTDALNAAARDLIRAVFAEVVAGRLTDAIQTRVVAAVCRQLEPDEDRTLLVTATAGVAAVDGSAGALSATGRPVPAILPPVGVAVSGACHLMWHYRGAPDKATGRRWLHQATEALERHLAGVLDARFAALGEAVDAVAADAVDHGVLLA